ncbi:uncharacterized protein BDCG_02243 [Blastomyces dermatitidis ER-3]|uniref:Uncharacterized protein n=1 Tax=Ajellomyces dermatitidis (strain ER-3 / ATCC MYA-2586) TaxID=559297 RepID=A0ABM9YGQ3_AJEDR|nr:uncharacterized protein BDCG_02243 [Blastomyces dermatitidis ER-3]EEQ87123.2 hypothetical protein BDCG_02243 [Blastomyces dermatitidis ER-3]
MDMQGWAETAGTTPSALDASLNAPSPLPRRFLDAARPLASPPWPGRPVPVTARRPLVSLVATPATPLGNYQRQFTGSSRDPPAARR